MGGRWTAPAFLTTRGAVYLEAMRFKVTARYGSEHQRYHTFEVQAYDAAGALEAAAAELPPHVNAEADLVEIRPVVTDEERSYLGE